MKNAGIPWQDYEELVKQIYEALGQAHGVTIECWGSNCRRTGKSGATYQIDVLATHSDGVHQYRTAIECKYWDKPVGRDVISKQAQLVQDIQVNKAVVVSKMGFSDQAQMVAQANNIGLVELRKPVDKDWQGRIRGIHVQILIKQQQIQNLTLGIVATPEQARALPEGPMSAHLYANQIVFEAPGQDAQALQQIVSDEQNRNPTAIEFDVQLPEGTIVAFPDFPDNPVHGLQIKNVSFTVKQLPTVEEHTVIRGEDHVHWIMHNLFEATDYTITADGMIREHRLDDDVEN